MKKWLVISGLILIVLLSGCETKKFTHNLQIKENDTYVVELLGTKKEGPLVITRDDILYALSIPEKHRIIKVSLSGVSVYAIANPDNQADEFSFKASWATNISPYNPIVKEGTYGVGRTTIVLANLYIASQVGEVSKILTEIIKGTSPYNSIAFQFEVSTAKQLKVNLRVSFELNVEYEYCTEMPFFLSDGPDCDL